MSRRGRGALLGFAIGDALGSQLDGKRLNAPMFPVLSEGIYTELTGGGGKSMKPGQTGQDTRLAAALAWSLREREAYDADDAMSRYKALHKSGLPMDEQTAKVLEQHAPNRPDVARQIWHQQSRRLHGNACLVRAVPLGLYFAKDENARREAVLADIPLTHFDFRCQISALCLSAALAAALTSEGPPTTDVMMAGVDAELSAYSAEVARRYPDFMREITDALTFVKDDLSFARKPDPLLYGPELHLHHQAGSVRVTFRLAFWELMHAHTTKSALLDATHRGGDMDTNGAITGALIGALNGEAALPMEWRKAVLDYAPPHKQAALGELYHPRQLLPLVDWDT